MARTRAAENPRSRSKLPLIEETALGISRFEEILTAIQDFSQEGFPYRDAARTKTETQFREYVRQIFGERSPEFQTYRNHKLRTSNQTETAQSVAVVKGLIQLLEDKKLELQGLKPSPAPVQPAETSLSPSPKVTLVPPTAQITMTPQRASTTQSMKVSVAMSASLGTTAAPSTAAPVPPPPQPQTGDPRTPSSSLVAPPAVPLPQPVEPPQATSAPPHDTESPVSSEPHPHTGTGSLGETVAETSSPSPAPTYPAINPSDSAREKGTSTARPETDPPTAATSGPPSSQSDEPALTRNTANHQSIQSGSGPDPVQLIRKVCLRFHAVVRQLRLRKDYRPTLEVDDVDDLQDLLWALLKMEFDEVGVDEWSPPYTNGAARRTFLLDRDQIAFVAKKTHQGLTPRELTDQVRTDSARYAAREKCSTIFCFIYDPEGRIGSPTRLESELASAGDHCNVEVLVAPK